MQGKKTQAAVRYERLNWLHRLLLRPRLQFLTECVKAQKETAADTLAKQCVCMCFRKFVFISKLQSENFKDGAYGTKQVRGLQRVISA
jgi:hypothetical protein